MIPSPELSENPSLIEFSFETLLKRAFRYMYMYMYSVYDVSGWFKYLRCTLVNISEMYSVKCKMNSPHQTIM